MDGKKYIDRDKILAYLSEAKEACIAISDIIFEIENGEIPASNVSPVAHGHWTLERDPDANNKPVCFHCSVCDSNGCHTSVRIAYKYCPNCGAIMDMEDK